MKEIIVVTHAESKHHINRIVGGWNASSLNKLGIKHSLAITNKIRNDFSLSDPVIYSSDLKRAMKTAQPIADTFSTTTKKIAGLREISYGAAEGKDQNWLKDRFIPPPKVGDDTFHNRSVELFNDTRHLR